MAIRFWEVAVVGVSATAEKTEWHIVFFFCYVFAVAILCLAKRVKSLSASPTCFNT